MTGFYYSKQKSQVQNTEINGVDYNDTKRHQIIANRNERLCINAKEINNRQQLFNRHNKTINYDPRRKQISNNGER